MVSAVFDDRQLAFRVHEKNQKTLHKTLRIALCLPRITGSAELIQQKTIADNLLLREHQLSVFAPRDLVDIAQLVDFEPQAVVHRQWSKSGWFRALRKITWWIQKIIGIPYLNVFSNLSHLDAYLRCLPGHDIVHERNGLYRAAVALACKRLNLPYVLFFDADDLFELDYQGKPVTGILRNRAKQIIQYSLNAAGGIITVSEATRQRLIHVWHIPEKKIAVFPNCVDVHLFQPYPEQKEKTRASFGLSEHPLILYVGNFYEWHDTATLLKGFADLVQIYPQAQLVLAGDGNTRQAVVKLSEQLAITPQVKFLGLVDRSLVPYLMSAADVLVSPYPKMEKPWWGSSMKLFEYLASGTATVASNIGEQVSATIEHERNGLLVPPEDPGELADSFLRLINDPALRARLGQQGRIDAIEKYSVERYMDRLEEFYQAVVEDCNRNIS